MFSQLYKRARSEEGFTLIELLIVVLIIGILAAIALPQFIGQQAKAQDAAAKSNARNMESQMESCFTDNQTYVGCDTRLTAANTGLNIGTGTGQVGVSSVTATSYVITAVSAATSGGAHNFIITHSLGTPDARTCTPANNGGCGSGGTW